jgi:ribosomal protein S14
VSAVSEPGLRTQVANGYLIRPHAFEAYTVGHARESSCRRCGRARGHWTHDEIGLQRSVAAVLRKMAGKPIEQGCGVSLDGIGCPPGIRDPQRVRGHREGER